MYTGDSFLEKQLKESGRRLRKTQTVVTREDGKRFLESASGRAELLPISNTFGFVVDTKPDDKPAKITKNLYLGSQDCCTLEVLRAHDIASVLSVGVEAPEKHAGFDYRFIPALDLPTTDLKEILEAAVPFIKKSEDSGANILIHCNAGVSRSVSVTVGYLMLEKGLDYAAALKIVKDKRPCARPNDGFTRQLKVLTR